MMNRVRSAIQQHSLAVYSKLQQVARGQSEATNFKRAFVYGAGLALAASLMDNEALAQIAKPTKGAELGDPMTSVSKFICTVGNYLRGPIGIGIVILMIVVAGVGFATGGKKSSGVIIGALAGAAIIFGARAIAGFVGTTAQGQLAECTA